MLKIIRIAGQSRNWLSKSTSSENCAALPTRLVAATRLLFCFDDFLGVGFRTFPLWLTWIFTFFECGAALWHTVIKASAIVTKWIWLHVGVSAHIERWSVVVCWVVIIHMVIIVIRVLHIIIHFAAGIIMRSVTGNLRRAPIVIIIAQVFESMRLLDAYWPIVVIIVAWTLPEVHIVVGYLPLIQLIATSYIAKLTHPTRSVLWLTRVFLGLLFLLILFTLVFSLILGKLEIESCLLLSECHHGLIEGEGFVLCEESFLFDLLVLEP